MDFIVDKKIKGLNFIEAVQAMKEGKKVRREFFNAVIYLTYDDGNDEVRVNKKYSPSSFRTYIGKLRDFEATDWEIVKEGPVTVKEVMNLLAGENPEAEVFINDKEGNEVKKASIIVREVHRPQALGALFGWFNMTDECFYKRKIASTLRRLDKYGDDLKYYEDELKENEGKRKVYAKQKVEKW